ncbi:MAG: ferritin family protein [Thermodesulfobacteriota bacterium]
MPSADEQLLIMLSTALEMEEKGQRHYEKAAKNCRNPLGREIFDLLAGYEVQHARTIREIYQTLKGGKPFPEQSVGQAVSVDLGRVFRDLAGKHADSRAEADEMKALEMGLEFESASIEFYRNLAGRSQDQGEKKFALKLEAEERGHLNLLADLKQYYADPEAWLMAKGRAGLDGA